MADSAFLSAAVDIASILADDDIVRNDTDASNETLVNDDFSGFLDFDFNETSATESPSASGFFDSLVSLSRGCGAVGRAVASDTRDPRFESKHRM